MTVNKRNSLIFLLFTLILILGLAIGLPNLKLSPGQPFSLGSDETPGAGGLGALISDNLFAMIIRGIWVLTLISIPIYIIVCLLTPEGRKRLRRNIITIILLLLLSQVLPELFKNSTLIQEPQATALPESPDQVATLPPTATFSPDPPAWISVLTILLATILISGVVIAILMLLRTRNKPQKSPLEKLAGEAQIAMDALQAGREFKSTIIHCYQEMVKVIEEEKGIYRETAMTPREFESNLIRRGLPQDPIKTITRLFEKVRYGSLTLDADEEKMAFTSLADIVRACQSIGAQHEVK